MIIALFIITVSQRTALAAVSPRDTAFCPRDSSLRRSRGEIFGAVPNFEANVRRLHPSATGPHDNL